MSRISKSPESLPNKGIVHTVSVLLLLWFKSEFVDLDVISVHDTVCLYCRYALQEYLFLSPIWQHVLVSKSHFSRVFCSAQCPHAVETQRSAQEYCAPGC